MAFGRISLDPRLVSVEMLSPCFGAEIERQLLDPIAADHALRLNVSVSAKAAGGDLNEKWPVLSTDRPFPF